LKTLSIQANRITSLEGLREIPQLEELYISDNLLTSLEPLSYAPELRILDVQNNPITSLRGVSALVHIENLWATGCKLERFDELEKELGDKKELTEVYFEATPLQKSNPVLYRNKVRLALPQVSKIDASKLYIFDYPNSNTNEYIQPTCEFDEVVVLLMMIATYKHLRHLPSSSRLVFLISAKSSAVGYGYSPSTSH
jgi:Leucine-rich repeat (LRR) protein